MNKYTDSLRQPLKEYDSQRIGSLMSLQEQAVFNRICADLSTSSSGNGTRLLLVPKASRSSWSHSEGNLLEILDGALVIVEESGFVPLTYEVPTKK